ncbi:MAG: PKD domain-containing protein [Flavobacteriales bacterium]|nr:PKD domain-containing protein [Flavobacteriales bacterium]
MKRLLHSFILVFSIMSFVDTQAQTGCDAIGNYCMDNTTINICSGSILDAGGGGPYPDANYTMTICSDTPGDVIQLAFSAFNLQTSPNANNSDYLTIYDGDDTSAPSLGSYGSNDLQGLDVTATIFNATGCLTLVFSDNGNPNDFAPGFECAVACTTPCAPPIAGSEIVDPAPIDANIQTISVCLNTPITFGNNGSAAAVGFSLVEYIWNFDDGIVQTNTGQDIIHTFTEPGEYVVTLTVEDNNGCQSLNIIPLQVLVSTIPEFPGMEDVTTCFGETVTLLGNAESTTWTALPPQVVSGQTYLADGAGFSYSTSLVFDFFDAGATLDDCADLYSVFVNMEHSYMGDLGLLITCPDGTTVNLVEWGTNGGGGTFLGEAIDDESTTPGIGYDYYWSPDATNGTWGQNSGGFGGSLPSGTYEAAGNLCDLVGCPLNGEWTFTVTDNLAIDNGYIFYWGLNLNPALYPGITTFTPVIGIDADSSYWVGPYIIDEDINEDEIVIDPDVPGCYDYTYITVNNFGCQFDTTITVCFNEAPFVTAGPDQLFSCGEVELEGGFQGMDTPSCGADGGIFNYCYNDGESFTWTFCPDDPGDGVSFMSFNFISGEMEGFFETFNVYDGNSTAAPLIATWNIGDATGQMWTATNATGCITVTFSADGSVSCGAGFFNEWTYEVSCTNGGPQFTWEWTPEEFLDNPNIPSPTVLTLNQNTTFTLVGYPIGHPDCASTDEVFVSVDPLGDPGDDGFITVCSTDAAFSLFDQLGGTPVTTGFWTDPFNANLPNDIFDPTNDFPGEYVYHVQLLDCELTSSVTVDMALPTQIEIINDTLFCSGSQANLDLLDLDFGLAAFSYSWTYDGNAIGNSQSMMYTPASTGQVCLAVTDACGYVATECALIEVEQKFPVLFEADTTEGCVPLTLEFSNLTDPLLYNSSGWLISNGYSVLNQDQFNYTFTEAGVYDVSLTLISALGCINDTTFNQYITVHFPPIAGWTAEPQPTDATVTEIFFSDASIGNGLQYQWVFDTQQVLGMSSEASPIFNFPLGVGGLYQVQLIVTDENGCIDEITGIIDIDDIFTVFIPNSFTPNGDGINEVFYVVGNDLDPTRYSLQIFNRWGDVVFESTDHNAIWTGNHQNGEYYLPDGIYNYHCVVVSASTGERKEIDGFINLMR